MNAPPALQLGFAPRPRVGRTAWLLLAVGILGASVVIGEHQETLGRLERAQAEALNASGRARANIDPRRVGDALVRANTVALELARPWDKAFAVLEAADRPGVAVLSVEPNAKGAELRITAEAKDAMGMLAYIETLRASPPFAQVTLQQHELRGDEPERPLRFTLIGTWRSAP